MATSYKRQFNRIDTVSSRKRNLSYVLYIAHFPNGKKYIGITSNFAKRKQTHLYQARTGQGYAFHKAIAKYGSKNVIWTILEESRSRSVISSLEEEYIAKFNTYGDGGYNSTLGGELGGKWTYDKVVDLLSRRKKDIKTRSEWERLEPNSYEWAFKNNLAREIADYLGIQYKNTYWSIDKVDREIISLKIKGRADWFSKSQNSYSWASRKDLIVDFAKRHNWNERNSWSEELVFEEIFSKGIGSLIEWRKKSRHSYIYASRNLDIKKIEEEMGWTPYRNEQRTIESMIYDVEEIGAQTIMDWRVKNSASYSYAKKYKLVDIIAEHCGLKEKVRWTKRKCIDLILQREFKSPTEWSRESSGSYSYARDNKLLNEIYKKTGMVVNNRKHTVADCRKIAREFGGIFLDKEFVNSKYKHNWSCKRGHKFKKDLSKIKSQGGFCPKCGRLYGRGK